MAFKKKYQNENFMFIETLNYRFVQQIKPRHKVSQQRNPAISIESCTFTFFPPHLSLDGFIVCQSVIYIWPTNNTVM